MLKKNIVLFDMDGTLTPPRESAEIPIAMALHELTKYATIGIVTGSHYDYLQQQCEIILNSLIGPDLTRTLLFPCNGGQYYTWCDTRWKKVADRNMQTYLGIQKFNELMRSCLYILNAALEEDDHEIWDLTGHFIEYRGPMVNLCFPGRQATKDERKKFEEIDSKTHVRKQALIRLITKLKLENVKGVECKLGGNTSIDIFPTGWDKTLTLEYLKDFDIWFVGDRCTGRGNDREIYEYAAKLNRGFQTTGPAETIGIIEKILKTIRGR